MRSPILDDLTGWVFRPLDVERMREGAACLVGEHDFTSFRASECQASGPVRTIRRLELERRGRLIGVRIEANAFLQHMVRNIVGTLIYVGTGREKPEWVEEVLKARSRAAAAPTFTPPRGRVPSAGRIPSILPLIREADAGRAFGIPPGRYNWRSFETVLPRRRTAGSGRT